MELWWLAENQRPQVLRDDVAICGTKKVMTSHPDGDAGWCWGQAEGLAVVVASTFRKNGPKFNHLQQLRRGSGHCGCRRCKWALACLLGCWSQNLWQRVESRWLSWPPAHLNSSVPLNYIPLRYTHIYIYLIIIIMIIIIILIILILIIIMIIIIRIIYINIRICIYVNNKCISVCVSSVLSCLLVKSPFLIEHTAFSSHVQPERLGPFFGLAGAGQGRNPNGSNLWSHGARISGTLQ